jgi:TPR repeat protein
MIKTSRLLRLLTIAALTLLLLWIYTPPFMDTLRDNACMKPAANKKYMEAFKGCSKRAQEGSPAAKLMLGKLYEDGRGTLQDYAKAEENYLEVANSKDKLYAIAALNRPEIPGDSIS